MRSILAIIIAILLCSVTLPTYADTGPSPTPLPHVTPTPSTPDSGSDANPLFQAFWSTHGGMAVFGMALTPLQVITINRQPVTVQWYERARFELQGEQVELGRLGVDLLAAYGIDWWSLPTGQPQSGCNYFEQTRHTLCGEFLTFWSMHANPMLVYGLPISEPRWELHGGTQASVRLTQWFERARFELVDGIVTIGPIGSELLSLQPPPPVNTPTPSIPVTLPTVTPQFGSG